ncbi:MAG: RAMP superfamily CRISPR-associated protein [Intestinibacter bartlettii]
MNFKLFAKDTSELKKEDQLMKNIIEGFKSGNLRLGANKMFGFGKFEVKKIEIREFDLEDRDDLISYILDDKKYNILNLNDFDNIKRHGYIEFDFTGSIIDSMIVKQIPQNKEVDYVNMVNSKDESKNPGTTIKGLFREYNTKILKTLNLEDKLFLVEDIYGTNANSEQEEHKIGKILTSDVVVKNPKYCVYNRIKVDRFTGGVVTGGKFDEERVQGDIGFRISLKKLEENNKAAVGLILLTFRDLGLCKLPIGSSS